VGQLRQKTLGPEVVGDLGKRHFGVGRIPGG
jgi:hypothetical protein